MTQRLKIPILVTLAAITAASCGAENADTSGETWTHITRPDHANREHIRGAPPMNVAAEDMNPLLAGHVFVGHEAGANHPSIRDYQKLKIIAHGPRGADGTGRYVMCNHGHSENAWYLKHLIWWPVILREGKREGPVLFNGIDRNSDTAGWLIPNYDPASGDIVWYTVSNRKGWTNDHNIGHLQERLPAAVYDLCPDFPSPEELGVEVNPAQTADRYDALLAQDRGQRVLRPDLVTEGLRERANGQQ